MQGLIKRVTGFAVDLFYRRSVLGAEVPAAGPVLLVGNHPNGLVDPALIMLITERPLRFLGKEPLFRMPVIGTLMRALHALPVYRRQDGADTALNEGLFDAVFRAFGEGDAVCLFPEGISHNEPALQALKTGAARMALGALASASCGREVPIVPVGLNYRRKQRFRSRAAVWVGEPIPSGDLESTWRRDERAAVRALTERIADGLERVTLNLDRWEDLPLVELAERIWLPAGADRLRRQRLFAEGLRALRERDPERLEDLVARVQRFREQLARLGLRADDLRVEYRLREVARFLAGKLALLVVGLPVAAAGAVLWWLPYRATGWLALAVRPEPDIAATTKLLAALSLFPLWYALLLAAGFELAGGAGLAAAALLAPLAGLLTLRAGERLGAALRDAAVFLRLGGAPALKRRLVARREALAAEIAALHAELRADGSLADDPARDTAGEPSA